jgi:GNAT superfamily N-acetyltransferase
MRNHRYLIVRKLKISDIVKLYKMYNSLSNESKRFFHPFPESAFYSPYFILTWTALSLSCIKVVRRILLKILPRFVYVSLCSTYLDEIVGFAFIKLKNNLYGELGIGTGDCYQGMGIGSRLMDNLIKLARKEGLKKSI